uniref:Retrotrans_gag domain-containing protein n=1 Tax=Strongyloides venezuelensis TaxID=75913 RepID=A0A0K0EVW0_STRVS
MEKLDRANRGGNGLKPLIQYMNPGEKNPTALAVELFFRTNISVIKEVYPDIIERENLREELKDRFERLLHQPLGNSLYIYYHKWKAVSPDCQFGYLIRVVKTIYERYVWKQFNLQSMKGCKQRSDESIIDYNDRFGSRLAEIYPDNENSMYRASMNEPERDDHWRMKIVNIYVASLTNELREKIPIFDSNNKHLEHAMNTAVFHEKKHIDRE